MKLNLPKLLTFAFASTVLGQSSSTNGTYSSLQAALASNSSLSQLANLLSPYMTQLANKTGITLFAPNNDAVAAYLNSPLASQVTANPNLAAALINYHIVNFLVSNTPKAYNWSPGRRTDLKSWLNETFYYNTLLNSTQYANVSGGQVLLLTPSNGIPYVYSGLLTISRVLTDAITYNGGEIYIIDRFLTIPPKLSDVAIAFGLTSWVGATRAVNLATTYDNYANLEAFIPTNAAFERVAGNLASLSTQQLTDVVNYHLYTDSAANDYYAAKTLQGTNITFRDANNQTFFVNNAHSVGADIITANGFLTIIDQVLNPSNTTILNLTGCDDGAVAFANPSSSTIAPYTNGIPTPTSSINIALATYTFITSSVTACPAKSTGSSLNGSPPADNPNPTGTSSPSSGGKKTNLGAILGGVLGGLGGLLLVILLLWLCRRKGYGPFHRRQLVPMHDVPQGATFNHAPNNYNGTPNMVHRPAEGVPLMGAGVGAGAAMYGKHMKSTIAPVPLHRQPMTEMEAQQERSRLYEAANNEHRRPAELSSPTAATIRDFNELDAYEPHHSWVADGGPQHYGHEGAAATAGLGAAGAAAAYGHNHSHSNGQESIGPGSRSTRDTVGGISNNTDPFTHSSSGAASSQPLVSSAGGMSSEMAFLRGVSPTPMQGMRRKPVSSSSSGPPISPVQTPALIQGQYHPSQPQQHMTNVDAYESGVHHVGGQPGSRFREI